MQNVWFPVREAHIPSDTASVPKLRFRQSALFHYGSAGFQWCFVWLCDCCVLCATLGGARGDARGEVTGGAVLYTEGRPRSTGGASAAAPPSRQLESKTGGSNATKAWQPCCCCWKTDTFRNAALQRKLPLLLIATFPTGKLHFLHVTPFAAQASAM